MLSWLGLLRLAGLLVGSSSRPAKAEVASLLSWGWSLVLAKPRRMVAEERIVMLHLCDGDPVGFIFCFNLCY